MTRPAEEVIVPRWEWRAFGRRFPAAERSFADLEVARVQESDDLYLVGADADDTVKVRDGLMDVKHLEQVDADGLEQWIPAMKAGFPLSAGDLERVRAALDAVPHSPARAECSLDEAVTELTAGGDIVAVEARKLRVRYTIGGCLTELTTVETDLGSACTIAVESEDPDRVVATVRRLGLDGIPNVSYPRWLAMLVGLAPARYAVIDVGTNSVKLHVAERHPDGTWSTVVDSAEVTRLGEGLARDGLLDDEPMERTAAAIEAMADQARRAGALEIAAVGTAGLRIAGNSADFVRSVEGRSGVLIEVIPGEEEARLAYVATTSALGIADEMPVVVFDSGGGSSQLTFGRGLVVEERFSVDVGAAKYTERFGLSGAVPEDVLREALEAIGADLARLDDRSAPDALVGMGGAITNLAAVHHGLAAYDSEIVQGTILDAAEIDRQIDLYRRSSAEERRSIVGLQPNRAPVILAGACIVRTIMAKLGADQVTVSDRGLRHGLLVERFGTRVPLRPTAP